MPRRYRTIVADPPWPLKIGSKRTDRSSSRTWNSHHHVRPVPYETMSLEEIAALPIERVAEDSAHLYVWTINRFLEQTFEIVRAWGFKPGQVLTWAKSPMGLGPGGAFAQSTEFVIFGRRGTAPHQARIDRTAFDWKRPYGSDGKPMHSAKPDAFLDMVEHVSPGPYVELFARRARFGWDYWGDESLGTAELPAPSTQEVAG